MCLLHQNVSSLKNELLELETNVLTVQTIPDIVEFMKTGLHDGFLNSGLELYEFDIHRQDRTIHNHPLVRGGNFMICTKKQLKAVPIV